MATREAIYDALSRVTEPETGCSLTDLGLVLDVDVDSAGRSAVVKMAQVPLARRLVRQVREALEALGDLEDGRLEFVRDPPWLPEVMATPEARRALAEAEQRPRPPAEVDEVRQLVGEVLDPELGYSLADLGLIYGVELDPEGHTARIRMSLTSPMCPVGPYLMDAVRHAALLARGVQDATVELVWDPPWDPRTMASEDVKMDLGL
ncbi:MAG TPA: iron-sulfur cluster assembly protein [Myxococcota bacterium]|nr:iron-sulfur cluster assembly protein [Myxococcota bacterium]HQK49864.1 iron-sulfur cluster assembly protein [Myxococcota bacterium]